MKRSFIKKQNKNQSQKGKGKFANKGKNIKGNDKPNTYDDANDY